MLLLILIKHTFSFTIRKEGVPLGVHQHVIGAGPFKVLL